jgi:hypothetical protein
MDRLLAACTCTLVAAILFGALGALYGASVRVMAFLRDRTSDLTYRQALWAGLKGGAVFMAVLGAHLGAAIGFVEPNANARMQWIVNSVGTVGELMALIALGIALPTTFVAWSAMKYRRRQSRSAAADETLAEAKHLARPATNSTEQSTTNYADSPEGS